MSNLKYVNDDKEFTALLKTAGNELIVVDFYTTWCGPCRQMEPVIESLVMKHPKVWFLKVDADKCFEAAMAHEVKGVPLFVIYMNSQIVDQIQGAHPQILDQKVSFYEQEWWKSNPSVPHLPEDRLSQLSQVISSIGKIRDVTQFLDEKGCRCINDLTPSPFNGFVNGKKLVSGKGTGKLVLVYSFKQRLMLHSFKIKANSETGPRVLRFFVNHPKLLDFPVATQLAPAQEVTLSADDLKGERIIELRAGSFSLVSNLQIFVTEGMTKGHNRIDIDSMTLYGAPVEMSSQSIGKSVAVGQSNINTHIGHIPHEAVKKPPTNNDNKEEAAGNRAVDHPHTGAENTTAPQKRPEVVTHIEFITPSGVDVDTINNLVEKLNYDDRETNSPNTKKRSDKPRNSLAARRSSNKPSGSSKKKSKKNKN